MVAVDPNILISIFAILSVLAYVFVLRRMKTKQLDPVNRIDRSIVVSKENTDEETAINESKTPELQQPKESSKGKSAPECEHHFSYLGTLPKRSKTPKECLQCCRMTECKKRKRPRKSNGNQIEAVLATDGETLQSIRRKPSEKKGRTTERK